MKKIVAALILVFIGGVNQSSPICPETPVVYNIVLAKKVSNDMKFLLKYPIADRVIVMKIAYELDIPIRYLYRLHKIESQMTASAVRHESNGTKSIGYSQINTSNLEYFANKFNNGKPIDLFDKETNIRIGAMYLKYLYNRLDGDWIGAMMSYNWGIGNFLSNKEVPKCVIDYSFSIVYGPDYLDCVTTITGAVKNMI